MEEKEFTNKPIVKEVELNEIIQYETIFSIVKIDKNYRICIQNKVISKEIFATVEDAQRYIDSKPWELIINATAVVIDITNNQNK